MKNPKMAGTRTLPPCRALAAALALALSSGAASVPAKDRFAAAPPTAATVAAFDRQPWRHARDPGPEHRPPSPDGIQVTNCNDAGPGSLRDAIATANDRDFVFATPTCSTITLTSGEIPIPVDNLQIFGPGQERLTVTGGGQSRVFRHAGAGLLNIYAMTVSGGYESEATLGSNDVRGGCIFSNGFLQLGRDNSSYGVTVKDCTVVANETGTSAKGGGIFAVRGLRLRNSRVIDNRAIARSPAFYARGGGVYAGGTFGMRYSEVSGNRAYGGMIASRGGGVDALGRGTSYILQSAIVNNQADRGAGAMLGCQSYGNPEIIESTISGNVSSGEAAGVYMYSPDFPARILASTITANRSSDATATAGVVVHGLVKLVSSIVSGNTSAGNPSDLELSADASGSHNLVGAFTGHSPPPDGLIHTTNPHLGPLARNGGITPTHALLPDSPEIDTGTINFGYNLYFDYDQRGRGFPHVIGPNADIGAYERDPDLVFRNGFD